MILAIDPGTTHSALVWFDQFERKVPREVWFRSGKLENLALLHLLNELDVAWPIAIEMIASYGMPVGREVFETCVWIGRFYEAAYRATGFGSELIYRRDVKLHLCGSPRAKDGNIRQALIDKLGPVGTKRSPGPCFGMKGDLWAALAVAVTFAETVRPPRIAQEPLEAESAAQ